MLITKVRWEQAPLQENRNLLSNFIKKITDNLQSKKISAKLIAVFVLGVTLMLLSHFFAVQRDAATAADQMKPTSEQVSPSIDQSTGDEPRKSSLEKSYEAELKNALELMSGVNNVTVMVKLSSSEKKVYEKNNSITKKQTEETDKDNGKRNIEEETSDNKVVVIDDGNQNIPLVIQTDMPEVTGVLIVADGVDNITIKSKVIEAVTKVLDVPSHRVAVMAR